MDSQGSKHSMKTSTKLILIGTFLIVGYGQQRYEKAADQAAYEAECAAIAANPNHPASPCVTPKRPDHPLPARG